MEANQKSIGLTKNLRKNWRAGSKYLGGLYPISSIVVREKINWGVWEAAKSNVAPPLYLPMSLIIYSK